jgi:hypothetical protein
MSNNVSHIMVFDINVLFSLVKYLILGKVYI